MQQGDVIRVYELLRRKLRELAEAYGEDCCPQRVLKRLTGAQISRYRHGADDLRGANGLLPHRETLCENEAAVQAASFSTARLPLRHCRYLLVGIDRPKALDDFERAALHLCDVHVQAYVMLAGDHLGRPARALGDFRVVKRRDHGGLVEGPGLCNCSLPELEPAVHTRAPGSPD